MARVILFVLGIYLSLSVFSTEATFTCPQSCAEFQSSKEDNIIISSCWKVTKNYTVNFVNIIKHGTLCFEEVANTNIVFRTKSILVEQGGLILAGSTSNMYGTSGGTLTIQLFSPFKNPSFITCHGNDGSCYPKSLREGVICCTGNQADKTDPCITDCEKDKTMWNSRFVPYGNLNYDPTPFGAKVLGVSYGGSIQFFGAAGVQTPNPSNSKTCDVPSDTSNVDQWALQGGYSWARLANTMTGNSCQVTIDHATNWDKGDLLVLTTSGWHTSQTEILRITDGDGKRHARTTFQVTLAYESGCPKFAHNGQKYSVNSKYRDGIDNDVKDIDNRAVVGLLSRSITIESWGDNESDDSPFPAASSCSNDMATPEQIGNCTFGGHTMFRQGFASVQVQGVEFKRLGQGGRMGHYPVHFHMTKETQYTTAFVRDISVWDSMTRIVTLHAAHDVTVERTVGAFNTGHAFYLEDAVEINNRICSNVIIGVRSGLRGQFAQWTQQGEDPRQRAVPGILYGSLLATDNSHKSRHLTNSGDPYITGTDVYQPSAFWLTNLHNHVVNNIAVGIGGYGVCYWSFGAYVSGPQMFSNIVRNSWPPPGTFQSIPANSPIKYKQFAFYQGLKNSPDPVYGLQKAAPPITFQNNHCHTAAYALFTTFNVYFQGKPWSDANPLFTYIFYSAKVPELYSTARRSVNNLSFLANPYNITVTTPPDPNFNYYPFTSAGSSASLKLANMEAPYDSCPEYLTEKPFKLPGCGALVVDRFHTSFNYGETNYASIWLRASPFFVARGITITDQLFGGFNYVAGGGSWLQTPPNSWCLIAGSVFVGRTHQLPGASYFGPEFSTDNCMGDCPLAKDGTFVYKNNFNQKRMLNIYDGPFCADSNIFLDTPTFNCTSNPIGPGECRNETNSQNKSIYATLALPCINSTGVPYQDATILHPALIQTLDSSVSCPSGAPIYVPNAAFGWKQKNGFYYPVAFGIRKSRFDNITLRHNVVDKYVAYSIGGGLRAIQFNELDFTTILNDVDGSLNGVTPISSTRTIAITRNHFHDGVHESLECNSNGLQTSGDDHATLIIGNIDSCKYNMETIVGLRQDLTNGGLKVFRQNVLAGEPGANEPCEMCNGGSYSCPRASFMTNPQVQPFTLVSSIGTYYIEMNSNGNNLACTANPAGIMNINRQQGTKIGITTLNMNQKGNLTIQIYVGKGATFQWMRYDPHYGSPCSFKVGPLSANGARLTPDENFQNRYNEKYSHAVDENGILTLHFDYSLVKDEYLTSTEDGCYPRTLCKNPTQKGGSCTLNTNFAGLQHADSTLHSVLKNACEYWSTRYSGTTSHPLQNENDPMTFTFSECPSGGCLLAAITLGDMSNIPSYNQIGNSPAYLVKGIPGSENLIKTPGLKDNPCNADTTVGSTFSDAKGLTNTPNIGGTKRDVNDDHLIFVCDSDGEVHALVASTGELLPTIQLPELKDDVGGCILIPSNAPGESQFFVASSDQSRIYEYKVQVNFAKETLSVDYVTSGPSVSPEGLSGISFRPRDKHVFCVVENMPITIFELDAEGNLIRSFESDIHERVFGVAYDDNIIDGGALWLVAPNTLYLITTTGELVDTYEISSIPNPEGITVTYDDKVPYIFVVTADGEVIKLQRPSLDEASTPSPSSVALPYSTDISKGSNSNAPSYSTDLSKSSNSNTGSQSSISNTESSGSAIYAFPFVIVMGSLVLLITLF